MTQEQWSGTRGEMAYGLLGTYIHTYKTKPAAFPPMDIEVREKIFGRKSDS